MTGDFIDDHHFSGLVTRLVTDGLRERLGVSRLESVLHDAGIVRPLGQLLDDASWTTYDEVRRLLEAAARELGGPAALTDMVATRPVFGGNMPEVTEMLQTFGSPAALFASVISSRSPTVSQVAESTGELASENELIVHRRFADGFEVFPAYCAFEAGLLAMAPRLFGYPPGRAVEEACVYRGDDECRYRLAWFESDDPGWRADYFETRSRVLESRLAQFGRTVEQLVAGDSLEGSLAAVVDAAQRTVRAPVYVLARRGKRPADNRFHSVGTTLAEARRVGEELLAGANAGDSSRLVVEIASNRRHFGYLAAIDHQHREFLPQEGDALKAYARLAAAALDTAAALDDARQEASTASVLLDLSASLAEVVSTEEMAAKLAGAIPGVIDCDRAAVILVEPERRMARFAGTYGYPEDLEARLRAMVLPVADDWLANQQPRLVEEGGSGEPPYTRALMQMMHSSNSLSVPIVVNGATAGWVTASVTEEPERLSDPLLLDRLRGIAGQAATAIRNAQLLDQVSHQALHDPLTDLPNRAVVLDRAGQMLARSRRNRRSAAALFLDLDGFKEVNDSFGHSAGDSLLKAVARRLGTALRESDTIGRFGGDEFVVLAEGGSLDAGPERVAERLIDVLREPFYLPEHEDHPITVTASIGIAAGDRGSAEALLRDADLALYAAKASGKGRYAVFSADMAPSSVDHFELDGEIRRALRDGELFLVYQPIFNLVTKEPTGVEALLRWRHPARGVVEPEEFMGVLEETGFIVDVGRWVLEKACRETASWRAKGYDLAVSVNVSTRQLENDSFPDELGALLALTGLRPEALILDVTETTIMRNAETTSRRLKALKALGVRIAIDDFGTGYSSFGYLRQFPVDMLKIDRSLIAAIPGSAEGNAVLRALINLGKALGLETLGEGIEDGQQSAKLQDEDCTGGQGYLFARPLEAEALESFLETFPPRPLGGSPSPGPHPTA